MTLLCLWALLQPKSLKWLVSSWCHLWRIVMVHVSLQWWVDWKSEVNVKKNIILLYVSFSPFLTKFTVILEQIRFYLTDHLGTFEDFFSLLSWQKTSAHTMRWITRISWYDTELCKDSMFLRQDISLRNTHALDDREITSKINDEIQYQQWGEKILQGY